ncbi:MAG: MFS transporter, partial [Halioglobus sp.]
YPLQWLNTIIGVLSIASLQILFVSLLADILDEHERDTGKRQEGVFFAASAFVNKTTSGVGSLVAGIVVQLSGIQAGSQPGDVSAQSLSSLGWFTIVIITLLALVAFFFARRIRLSRADHQRLREELGRRAGALAAPGADSPEG